MHISSTIALLFLGEVVAGNDSLLVAAIQALRSDRFTSLAEAILLEWYYRDNHKRDNKYIQCWH